ncbi:MAG: alpha-L-fucosidase, partial [Treponema sp.]|nr:alpha-L-fucosidase [Treponema sp.]
MSYSLRSDEADISSMSIDQHFSDEDWNRYPFASPEDLAWFRDARYGLFIHHGICALGKVDIGWSRHTHKMPDGGVGPIPDEVYDGWSRQFAMENFDAREWARAAADGGMKYVVIITKHHDGFHLWDTRTSEHKITRSPFGRDYLKELVGAFRNEGLKIGFYFSQRDFFHPDYEPVDPATVHRIDKPPYFAMNPGQTFSVTDRHKKYIRYMHEAVKELMTNYGTVDLLFWDAGYHNGMFISEMWDSEAIEREVRRLQPRILINNRASLPGDYDTPELTIGAYRTRRPWETCMPLTSTWAWSDTPVKPFAEVLGYLIQCVCGDGNFLLSIGAMADGRFAPNETERIKEIGAWLKQYG